MRILLINQNWFAPELRELGHDVLTCGVRPHLEFQIKQPFVSIDDLLRQLPNGFVPDRIVWLDHSGPNTVIGLEDCPIPTLFYSVDTHHHFLRHASLAFGFDHVCGAQRDLLSHFEVTETPTTWFPLWASEYVESSTEKRYGAVFVGTLNAKLNPARVAFFEKLKDLIPIDVLEGHFPTIFPHAEIVINQTVKGDLNFRVFEALMCGALLLTEASGNGLLDLFRDGTHLVTYTPQDPKDAASKALDLLAQPARMRSIAYQGRSEVLAKHTAKHRALTLEGILNNLKKRTPHPSRYYGAMDNLLTISLAAEASSKDLSAYTSDLALKSALKALSAGATLSDLDLVRFVKAALRHDLLFRDELGARVINEFARAFPDTTILSLLQLRNLLNLGKMQEARELALMIAKSKEDDAELVAGIFSTAENAANLLLDELSVETK